MADNTAQNATDTIATDDVTTLNGGASSGVKVQRVKVGFGDDGTARDVSTAFPMPTTLVSSGGLATSAGSISASATNTPGSAVTASTTAQVIANTMLAGNATFHIVATAFVGTLVFEGSVDGGFNYAPIMALREDGTGAESSAAISTAAAYIRQYTVALPGLAYFRVRCSAFTSGTAAVLIAPGPFLIEPNPTLAAGTATIGSMREQQDAGRIQVSLVIDTLVAVATEALASYGGFNGSTALTLGTAAFTVPAGRVFRIQSASLSARGTAIDTVRVRVRGAAAVAVGSQHYLTLSAAFGANAGDTVVLNPAREIEIAAGQQVGISIVGATTTTTAVAVAGYTYVP